MNKWDSKYYILEFIEGKIRRLEYKGRVGSLYAFKYSNLKDVRRILKVTNGIYIVTKDGEETMDVYVGQTTNGVFRFNEHKMKEFQSEATIYFFSFENQEPTKNTLDYIEKRLIELAHASQYTVLNGNKGNSPSLSGIDTQDVNETIPKILDLLKVFGFVFNLGVEQTQEISNLLNSGSKIEVVRNHDDEFFGKSSDYDFTIQRSEDFWILKKGSKLNSRKFWEDNSEEEFAAKYFFEKHISLVDERGVLTEDIVWKTISPLVAFAKGLKAANGWEGVVNKEGMTPHNVYRE